jgi:hypothetical protein
MVKSTVSSVPWPASSPETVAVLHPRYYRAHRDEQDDISV